MRSYGMSALVTMRGCRVASIRLGLRNHVDRACCLGSLDRLPSVTPIEVFELITPFRMYNHAGMRLRHCHSLDVGRYRCIRDRLNRSPACIIAWVALPARRRVGLRILLDYDWYFA